MDDTRYTYDLINSSTTSTQIAQFNNTDYNYSYFNHTDTFFDYISSSNSFKDDNDTSGDDETWETIIIVLEITIVCIAFIIIIIAFTMFAYQKKYVFNAYLYLFIPIRLYSIQSTYIRLF